LFDTDFRLAAKMATTHTARFFEGDRPVDLEPAVVSSASAVTGLHLIVAPGTPVEWGGRTYRLDREGRYCFSAPDVVMRNVIVFRDDYLVLFFALSQIHVKGWRHRSLTVPERINVARQGRLSVMCGGITSVVLALLAPLGHACRRVNMLTVGRKGSHVLFEYYARDRSKWILVDIHNHALLEADGNLLSVAELADRVRQGETFGIRRLSRLGAVDFFCWKQDNDTGEAGPEADLIIYDDETAIDYFGNPARRWSIFDAEDVGWFADDDAAAAAQLSGLNPLHRGLSRAEWEGKFCAPPPERAHDD